MSRLFTKILDIRSIITMDFLLMAFIIAMDFLLVDFIMDEIMTVEFIALYFNRVTLWEVFVTVEFITVISASMDEQ